MFVYAKAPAAEKSQVVSSNDSLQRGSIEGRVLNATNGAYLENVRVRIAGSNLQVFTNSSGEYRFSAVPLGMARLNFFYTGLEPVTLDVSVESSAVMNRDVSMGRGKDSNEILVLDKYVVEATREYNGKAIAINEQRFAPNIKNVVASDEFGEVADGNFALFLKFIPGVTLNYTGYNVSSVSVRGVPPENTPFTVDGNPSVTAGASRTFNPETLLLNNIARVEVTKTPTPDQSANSLGGAINAVTKSAFEESKPVFRYRVYTNFNSQSFDWGKQAGPNDHTTGWHIRPCADFSYVVPVSKTLGFTVGGLYTSRYQPTPNYLPTWSPISSNQATGTATNPALVSARVLVSPAIQSRWSLSGGLDWKFAQYDTLRFRVTQSGNSQANNNMQTIPNVGTFPTNYSETMTQGRVGGGTVLFNTGAGEGAAPKIDSALSWIHAGPTWKFDASVAYAKADFKRRDVDVGVFASASAVLRNVTVAFQDITPGGPPKFTTTTAAGVPVDGNDANTALLENAQSTQYDQPSTAVGARFNMRRDLDFRVPVTVRAGLAINRDKRDTPYFEQLTYTFVGPDRIAGNADNAVSLYNLIAHDYSKQPLPYGIPAVNWMSNEKFTTLFKQHPEYFSLNDATAIAANANNANLIIETVSAAYIRGDIRLLQNRLLLVGGVRFEHTSDDGYGVLNDIRATYQQDAQGNLILGSNGRPILRTGTAADRARLQYTARGSHVKRGYEDYYPSLNATFNLRENLLVRAGWARTIGRPNYTLILPGVSIGSPDAAIPAISANNTGLLPWTADNFDLSLEYYPKGTSVISVGVFQKNLSNFFGATQTPATSELLASYGLDDSYLNYVINSRNNVGDAKVKGFEFNVRQSLNNIHPLLRGVGVFVNGTMIEVSGANIADFSGFSPRTINWGVSYNSKRLTVQLNWNYNARRKLTPIVGAFIPADTYRYTPPWLNLDVSAEWRCTKNLAVFAGVRNVTNASTITEAYAPNTPSYARLVQDSPTGAIWNVGIKGSF